MKQPIDDKNNERPKPKSNEKENRKKEDEMTFWEKILRDNGLPKARQGNRPCSRLVLRVDNNLSPISLRLKKPSKSRKKTTVVSAKNVHSSCNRNDAHDEVTDEINASNASRKRWAPELAGCSKSHASSYPEKRNKTGHIETQDDSSDDDDNYTDCSRSHASSYPGMQNKTGHEESQDDSSDCDDDSTKCECLNYGRRCCGSPSMTFGPTIRSNSPQRTEKTLAGSSSPQNKADDDAIKKKKKEPETWRKRQASRSAASRKTRENCCPTKRKKTRRAASQKNQSNNGADTECSDCGLIGGTRRKSEEPSKKKRKKRKPRRKKKAKPCCCS